MKLFLLVLAVTISGKIKKFDHLGQKATYLLQSSAVIRWFLIRDFRVVLCLRRKLGFIYQRENDYILSVENLTQTLTLELLVIY